mmetsp:Transcript_139583/g.389328  ORF Transcript_139583/g.389328 Transcript_139583/m.389328 type:complete len:208 (-) Transcript_139583:44-667(-)
MQPSCLRSKKQSPTIKTPQAVSVSDTNDQGTSFCKLNSAEPSSSYCCSARSKEICSHFCWGMSTRSCIFWHNKRWKAIFSRDSQASRAFCRVHVWSRSGWPCGFISARKTVSGRQEDPTPPCAHPSSAVLVLASSTLCKVHSKRHSCLCGGRANSLLSSFSKPGADSLQLGAEAWQPMAAPFAAAFSCRPSPGAYRSAKGAKMGGQS